MDKFSLYDILGIILPGVVFLFFLSIINKVLALPISLDIINFSSDNDMGTLSVFFSFAFIVGSCLYVLTFYLIRNKWYNKLFGMYKPTGALYLQMSFLHNLMNQTLNKKAKEQFKQDIFFTEQSFKQLEKNQQKSIITLQGEFYDVMYYELEHEGKISYAKAFQSFYFFFRQMVTALCLLIVLTVVCALYNILFQKHTDWQSGFPATLKLISFLGLFTLLCTWLAQWYRKRMVLKMYWAYYTLLNSLKK